MIKSYFPHAKKELECLGPNKVDSGNPVPIEVSLGNMWNTFYVSFISCEYLKEKKGNVLLCTKLGKENPCCHDLSSSLLKEKFFPEEKTGNLEPYE